MTLITNSNALHLPIASKSVQCCVTSPPYYGLRDYGVDGQIGLEQSPDEYVSQLVSVFREVRSVLKDAGGSRGGNSDFITGHGKNESIIDRSKRNSSGVKTKDLIGIPWMIAFALRADGWYLRSDIIWSKPNPMPESVSDRPTKSHEYLFLLSKSAQYYYDSDAIKEPDHPDGRKQTLRLQTNRYGGDLLNSFQDNEHKRFSGSRNKRSVWSIPTQPTSYAHFATYPEKLVEPCILAGSRPGDYVLDPFSGSGTTGRVAIRHGRKYIGCELNFDYISDISKRRLTVQPYLSFHTGSK